MEEVIKELNKGELKEWELIEFLVNYREKKVEAIFEMCAG